MPTLLKVIYPPECLVCAEPVDGARGLCGACWAQTPFLTGHGCHLCGAPLPGAGDGAQDLCDECLALPRPWQAGRAALGYAANGRRLVLSLKHSDRLDLVPEAARWMARAGADLLAQDPLIVPVPVHWTRLARRRYSPAAELARALARAAGAEAAPRALIRHRRTPSQGGRDVEARFRNLDGAIGAHPRHGAVMAGREVCLIDDVMTSGATFSACAAAALGAGARRVTVLALARSVKDP